MKQKVIKNVFADWEETLIWSCLQGIMGEVYTNDAEDAALAILGDFAFYAGKPREEVVRFKPKTCKNDFMIMVPQNTEWANLIEEILPSSYHRIIIEKDLEKGFDYRRITIEEIEQ